MLQGFFDFQCTKYSNSSLYSTCTHEIPSLFIITPDYEFSFEVNSNFSKPWIPYDILKTLLINFFLSSHPQCCDIPSRTMYDDGIDTDSVSVVNFC